MTDTIKITFDPASLAWDKMGGLLPTVIQCERSAQVLMVGYMNEAALRATLDSGLVTFYSRSKQRLWQKGETSGNVLRASRIFTDCDQDTLLIMAQATGPTCHTGTQSCFGNGAQPALSMLSTLERTIRDRKDSPVEGSYTNDLFTQGLPRIAQKVGEEGVEVALAGALRADNLTQEAADLLYHLLVLLTANDKSLADVLAVLQARAQPD